MNTPDRPLRVSITGIDGSGKDTTTKASLEQFSREHEVCVVKLGRPAYRIDCGNTTQFFAQLQRLSIDCTKQPTAALCAD